MNEVTLTMKNIFTLISTKNGKVGESFIIKEIDGDISAISISFGYLLNEIIVMYEEQLWKVHLKILSVKCVKLRKVNFANMYSSFNHKYQDDLGSLQFSSIVTSNILGLINIENLNNSHLIKNSFWDLDNNYQTNYWKYGGIAHNNQDFKSIAFFQYNSKNWIIYLGYLQYENNILAPIKLYSFTFAKSDRILDFDFKIDIDSKNNVYLASSNYKNWIKYE